MLLRDGQGDNTGKIKHFHEATGQQWLEACQISMSCKLQYIIQKEVTTVFQIPKAALWAKICLKN